MEGTKTATLLLFLSRAYVDAYTVAAFPQHVAVYHVVHQLRNFRRAVHLRLLEMV